MKTMLKSAAVAAALCAILAGQAEARTLYVNASRPNNKGNGLKAATAKKTIQAAINIAKAGDTIIVYPGTYAPIKTNNRKITIKSKSGAGRTVVSPTKNWWTDAHVLNLGTGPSTSVAGFTVSPMQNIETYSHVDDVYNDATSEWERKEVTETNIDYGVAAGIRGGNVSNCKLVRLGNTDSAKWTFYKAKLTACVLDGCYRDTRGNFITGSTLNRCKVLGHDYRDSGKITSSQLFNTQITETKSAALSSCVLANCTVADNSRFSMKSTQAYNTVFHKVSDSQFKKSKKNALKNCYKGKTPKFVATATDTQYGDYHLAKGSPCIDKGTKAAAAKKLYGSKDLDGRKRVRGKSVDIGCYEY